MSSPSTPPSDGRGMPEGQGLAEGEKELSQPPALRAPSFQRKEGRSGKKPSTPFRWKGDARRAGGWPKGNESEANLRRYAPPPSRGRREK